MPNIKGRALIYQKVLLESEKVKKLKLLKTLKSLFKKDGLDNAFDKELKKFLDEYDPTEIPDNLTSFYYTNIQIKNNRIKFNGFDRSKAKEFWVITSDYLLSGGDRMDFFQKGTEIIRTNVLIRDALIEEVKIQGTLINDERKRIE